MRTCLRIRLREGSAFGRSTKSDVRSLMNLPSSFAGRSESRSQTRHATHTRNTRAPAATAMQASRHEAVSRGTSCPSNTKTKLIPAARRQSITSSNVYRMMVAARRSLLFKIRIASSRTRRTWSGAQSPNPLKLFASSFENNDERPLVLHQSHQLLVRPFEQITIIYL